MSGNVSVSCQSEKPGKTVIQIYSPTRLTVIDFAQVRQLVSFTEVVHEVGQTWAVQMCGVIGEQGPDKFPEP
jgi:hypothetical protein